MRLTERPLLARNKTSAATKQTSPLFVTDSMTDHHVYVAQQINVSEHVAAHGDDVCVLSLFNRAGPGFSFHGQGRPVSSSTDRDHRVDAIVVHPGIELLPQRLAMKAPGDTAVCAGQHR